MAVVRLDRSISLTAPRRKKPAVVMTMPSLQCPTVTRLGARVEVFYERSWVGATVLSGNLPGSAAPRVRIDDAPASRGYCSITRCLVRVPSTVRPENTSSKKEDAAATADDGNISTLPSVVTPGTAKAIIAAANGYASTSRCVIRQPSPAMLGTCTAVFRSPTSIGKARSCGRAPVPDSSNGLQLLKRSLEPTKVTDSQKKIKSGPGMGISRAALQSWFEEVKLLDPNARMWHPPM